MSKKNPKKPFVLRKKVKREDDDPTKASAESTEEEVEAEGDEEEDDVEDDDDDEPKAHMPSFLEGKDEPETTPPPTTAAPASGPPPTTAAPAPTKPTKPAKPEKPDKSEKKPKLEEWEQQLLDYLQFIKDYHQVTVPQFRAFSNLGTDARRVLDQYVEQELLEEVWPSGSGGQYVITEKGEARRIELGGPPPPMTTMPVQ